MIRLYFNKRGQLPWSIDSGPGTTEKSYRTIHTIAHGVSRFRAGVPLSETEPVAWVEFPRAVVREDRDVALILDARA